VSGNQCHCGKPIQDTGSLCPACGELLRRNLHKIADRWPELEKALTTPTAGGEKGKTKNSMVSVGTDLNERAVAARRACTDVVWLTVQFLREDFHDAGWTFTEPPTTPNRSQDDTPVLARWIAAWHVTHITHRPVVRESAEEIARDVERAERLTFEVTETSPPRQVPTGMACEGHTTSVEGERAPCRGVMRATLGDQMPDLVCSEDTTHRIPPDVWSRNYWKRAHTMDEGAARRLAERITG
jgi:hypothetical protein